MQDEVTETEVRQTAAQDGNATVQRQTVARSSKMPTIVLIQRIVWFAVGVINSLIGLRFVLLLLGANRDVPFMDFVYTISAPFVAPFVGIFGEPSYGRSIFEVSSILAIVVYLLIGLGIVKLLTITRPDEEI